MNSGYLYDGFELSHMEERFEAFMTARRRTISCSTRKAVKLLTAPLYVFDVPRLRREYEERENKVIQNSDVYEFEHNGKMVKMYLPLVKQEGGDRIQTAILRRQTFFEADVLDCLKKEYIKADSVILDCGANIGNHTVYFAKYCRPQKIYAIEAMPKTFAMLKENIRLNGIEEVVVPIRAALGDSDGYADVDLFNPNNIGATSLKRAEHGDIVMCRMDSLCQDKVDFVKMDVEGFEYEALLGMKRILERSHPTIFIEVFPENYSRVADLLVSYGYKMTREFSVYNYIFE